jgi:hypothetical protein
MATRTRTATGEFPGEPVLDGEEDVDQDDSAARRRSD